MKRTNFLLALTATSFALAGCMQNTTLQDSYADGSPNPNAKRNQGVVAGALMGGILGAATAGGDEKLEKTLAAAAVGGIVGGVVGSRLDQQAAELRRDLDTQGVRIVNTGNELIVTLPQDVLFAVDSATLRPDLRDDLMVLAGSLNRYPDTRVEVIGHTDNTGEASYNQRLSEERADSVAYVLIAGGVARQRVISYGRGEDDPIASNLNEAGRAQNRRVEFVITPRN
jgi:outer membrane protein OmpA-like peptidoglycan-associated protein